MDFEWLKVLLEKTRLIDLVIALACASGCALLGHKDVWFLIFVGCIAYIIVSLCRFIIEKLKQRVIEEEDDERYRVRKKNEEDEFKREAWLHFYSMSDQALRVAIAIFDGSKDPTNKYTRLIKNDHERLYGQVECDFDSEFKIYKYDRSYFPLLTGRYFGNNSVFEFNPYFFSLVEHYILTGKKELV